MDFKILDIKKIDDELQGNLPPYNLGRDDIILFKLLKTPDFTAYYPKTRKMVDVSRTSVSYFLQSLGFNTEIQKSIVPILLNEVSDPNKPKWFFSDGIWNYNRYEIGAYSKLYKNIKKGKRNINRAHDLELPKLHAELFNNVCNSISGVKYLAYKFKKLLDNPYHSTNYTVLRGASGTGKTLIISYLGKLVGGFGNCTVNEFLSRRNGFLLDKSVILFEEIVANNRQVCKFFANLSELVGSNKINVNIGFSSFKNIDNRLSVFITTNNMDYQTGVIESRYSELNSKPFRLNELPLFGKLYKKNVDYMDALLKETPEFFNSLLEWDTTELHDEAFIDPRGLKETLQIERNNLEHAIKEVIKSVCDNNIQRAHDFFNKSHTNRDNVKHIMRCFNHGLGRFIFTDEDINKNRILFLFYDDLVKNGIINIKK